MNRYNWVYSGSINFSPETIHFADKIRKNPVIAALLAARGVNSVEEFEKFNNKSPADLHSPYLMKDMERAVERINLALESGETITVYGDYDVDGITSVSMLVSYLRKKGADVNYYIPDRLDEGYGINPAALCSLFEEGTTLLITVDTGITATEEIETAKYMGMDVIVTDHHRCKEEVPDCCAVINPAQPDCNYPFKKLAGVGVVFKLICALEKDAKKVLDEYGDILALGTVADVVELTGENRTIVDYGLKIFRNTKNTGLLSLINVMGINIETISVTSIGFSIAPKINAAGRIGDASLGVKLLLSSSSQEAEEISELLLEENKNRQELERHIYEEAQDIVSKNPDYKSKPVLVIWGEGWHHGVIGIVASKISEKYSKPCILITIDGDMAKGSGRSVEGFNLFEALQNCSDIFVKFGGHALAAGLTLRRENLPLLDEELNKYAATSLKKTGQKPVLNIDFELPVRYINITLPTELELLEPCGTGNPAPVFSVSGCKIVNTRMLSDGKHLRLTLEKEGKIINAIGFGMGSDYNLLIPGDHIDISGNVNLNTWNGNTQLQFIVTDMRYSDISADVNPIPDRDDFALLYTLLKRSSKNGIVKINKEFLLRKLQVAVCGKFNFEKLLLCLNVFREQHLLTYVETETDFDIFLLETSGKVDICASELLTNYKNKVSD